MFWTAYLIIQVYASKVLVLRVYVWIWPPLYRMDSWLWGCLIKLNKTPTECPKLCWDSLSYATTVYHLCPCQTGFTFPRTSPRPHNIPTLTWYFPNRNFNILGRVKEGSVPHIYESSMGVALHVAVTHRVMRAAHLSEGCRCILCSKF